ncbi:DMT family transporter [Janibacter hoylei]|uniref:DMT family transporter n=1 Tax=Janibacter hoylei TaxID=364298 RepID=UPI0036B98286
MRAARDQSWLVAIAASLWGVSAIWRSPLAQEYPSVTVAFWEHVVLVLLIAPWVLPAVRRLGSTTARTQLSVIIIGAGSSALATVLFTAAFRVGDPITPQVLQKMQPLIAIALSAIVLREHIRPKFAAFALPALLGAWMLAFPDPLVTPVQSAQAALLATGAASLWAAGTVLGRLASAELNSRDLLVLRFTIGLITLGAVAGLTSTPLSLRWSAVPSIVPLAAISGLLALSLYYRALARTPASRATLAELAFPLTAAAVGLWLLDARLSSTQWIGFAILLVTISSLIIHENRSPRPAVAVASRASEAVPAVESHTG